MMNLNDSKKKKPEKSARHRSRCLIIQALYQWFLTAEDIAVIVQQFKEYSDIRRADKKYFQQVLQQIMQSVTELDNAFAPFLDRKIEDLNPVELQILRLGCYELTKSPDIPYRVVINEAIELAKTFGAEDSHKYVNGVLDKVAHLAHPSEIKK